MIGIAGGEWRATLLPARGGALATLTHAGADVLAPLPEGADPNDTWAGAFVMLPWTNRLDEGRLPHPGGVQHFPLNRVVERTALHGLSREHEWEVENAAPDRATLVQRIDITPYRYVARMEVRLAAGFSLALTVTNDGADGTPFGTGWHPFFTRPPGTRIAFRAAGAIERDARNLPIGCAPSAGIEGGEETFAGEDTHYTGWDGAVRLDLGARSFALQGKGAWSRNLQIFAPRGAGVICAEPVSHVPDVVNRPRFAPLGDMRRLARGAAITGGVSLLPLT